MSEEFDIQGNVIIKTGDAEAALNKLRDKQAAADKAQLASMSKIGSVAMVAGAALVGGLTLMAKGSAEAETANLGLARSLLNTGEYSIATMARIDSLTDSLRQQTGVSDETQKAAIAFASTMHLTEVQSEKLLPLLMDMSAVTGMDLQQGFRASAQAMTGNVGLFQRYGVIIKKNADGTVDFNDVLKQLCIYAGQASAKVSGLEGAGILLKSAIEELGESMGQSLIPELTKAAHGLTTLVEKFNDMPSAAQAVITQSVLVAGGILLIGGATLKTIVGIAQLKTSIDTLTGGAGWAALMRLLGTTGAGVLGVGAAMVAIPAAAMTYAQSEDWAKKRQAIIDNFNNGPAQLGGRGTINRGVVTPSAYPSRTWTPENAVGLAGVQAGLYTQTPEQVAAMDTIANANDDLQHKLYDASHTEKQNALHDLDLEVAAYQQAGADKVGIAQYSAARRAQIEKQYAKETASWSPINVSGVNVSGLSSYIGSLEGAVKVKKAELQLTLKIDGTSIKVDQSALAKLKETLGALVYAKVMAALGGSAAFGG
jgi:hypothetical protein